VKQAPLPTEIQELVDRWVAAVEAKDIDGLASVFHSGPDLVVFWSNGERTVGWDEVRSHIEADFRKKVDLEMTLEDIRMTSLVQDARTLTYRYAITVTVDGESQTFRRLASMVLRREPAGWRAAALHVSTVPLTGARPA